MSAQNILYCVGAPKSGTSWLFDYFYYHPTAKTRALKEVHYWDSLEGGRGGFWLDQHRARRADLAQANKSEKKAEAKAFQDAAIAAIDNWVTCFDGQTRDDAAYLDFISDHGKAGLAVDFTPSYGSLSAQSFQKMADLSENARFLFLMRDPVERILSHLRMDSHGDLDKLNRKIEKFLSEEDSDLHILRSNYRRTINNLLKVVPRERVHFEYYETLFSDDAIQRLCAFAGLEPAKALFEKRVHKGLRYPNFAAPVEKLRQALNPQYNFVEKFMGELPAEWTQKMVNV
ncbi:sulfotransferase [Aliiroseovarius crassostreae]|uniref:sulfotransferase n=1 Tax=Aliiroseovarius crassostreae TaxID=154981 RepID=UPI0022042B1F|nr:sulfotransferase [Aliiroseovarius crassostreae]UWQ05650.1 sulfotransferase [Aliiroseovarius crassostreae]UWQ09987.1 sulfotransferase [Aliiroseovarius crassostreae]